MANSLTTNPWVIDTASPNTLYATDVEVKHMEYAGYGAQGNQCIVQDRFGKVVWAGIGDADLEVVKSGPMDWIHGIAVPTLQGGGILRIYFK